MILPDHSEGKLALISIAIPLEALSSYELLLTPELVKKAMESKAEIFKYNIQANIHMGSHSGLWILNYSHLKKLGLIYTYIADAFITGIHVFANSPELDVDGDMGFQLPQSDDHPVIKTTKSKE